MSRWSRKLKKGGALAFELGENQADAVKALMTDKGFSDFKISLDFWRCAEGDYWDFALILEILFDKITAKLLHFPLTYFIILV